MLSDKYKKLNTKINKWFANKEQDIDILTSLYNQCNLEENSLIDRSENIKKNTMFSDLTNEELFAKFEKEHFTELTDKELKHLFQEAHNRFIKENGLDVTRNIVVEEDSPNNKYRGGYVRYSDDLLFLNKSLINQGNKTKDLNKFYNERSIGKIFLCTLFHETKHVIQYEDAIDFALGNKQEKDRAFAGALMIVNNTNFWVADSCNDPNYIKEWRAMYNWLAYEHEANYTAIKRIEQFYAPEKKNTLDYARFMNLYAFSALHFEPDPNNPEKNEKDCQERINKIEQCTLEQIEYFENGTDDCELKKNILNQMKEYTTVDKNGHSPLRDRLNKEVRELCDYYIYSKKRIDKLSKQSINNNNKIKQTSNSNDNSNDNNLILSLL